MRFRQNLDGEAEFELEDGSVLHVSALEGLRIPCPSTTIGPACGRLEVEIPLGGSDAEPRIVSGYCKQPGPSLGGKPSITLFHPPGGIGSWIEVPEDQREALLERLSRIRAKTEPGGKA